MTATASIEDRGYQRYAGERLGLGYALWVIVLASLRRAMGLRRSARAKILPWLLVAVPYAVVGVILIIREVSGALVNRSLLPGPDLYSGVYAGIALALILFCALVGPDLLCPDRREHVLALYFVSPITRFHYIAARLGGLLLLMLGMTVIPALLLFLGGILLAGDPLSFLRDRAADLPPILLGGLVLSVYYGATAMAIAAFNERRHYAGGTYVGILIVSSIASGILVNSMHFANHRLFALIDLTALPLNTEGWIFGSKLPPGVDGWAYLAATIGVIVVSVIALGWQYSRVRD
jgi:ABC-2 type transport system permease protein